MDVALRMMAEHASIRKLLNSMVSAVYPLGQAVEAMGEAQRKGVLKVQVSME